MKKDIYHIRQLLSLYYSGMASGEQERELADYFANVAEEELADDLRADRLVVLAQAAPRVAVPEALRAQLAAHIDRMEQRERRARRGRRLTVWASVAASVAIVLSTAMFIIKDSSMSAYELTDPDEAQVEAQHALLIVSECLNKADRKAEETDLLLERIGLDMGIFDDEDYAEPADSMMLDQLDIPASGEHIDSVGV